MWTGALGCLPNKHGGLALAPRSLWRTPSNSPPPPPSRELPREPGEGLFGKSRRLVHGHPLLTDFALALALFAISTIWLVDLPFLGATPC